MVKLSIIVPVYKVEKYLPTCLDSVLSQTYKDWECLLIDDGSPDDSGRICDEYSAKDDRFKTFHKKNGGVSAARNYGIDRMSGKYCLFLDSDDYLDSDCFEICMREIETNNLDCLQFGFKRVNPQGEILSSVGYDVNVSDCDGYYKTHQFLINIWVTVVDSDIIKRYNIRYDETIRLAEDQLFLFDIISRSKRIKQIPNQFYNYLQLSTSSGHNYTKGDTEKSIETIINKSYNNQFDRYLHVLVIEMIVDYFGTKDAELQLIKKILDKRKLNVGEGYALKYKVISMMYNICPSATLRLLQIYGKMKKY